MRRWFLILLTLSILIFSGYVFFYNGISGIERMMIQTYNQKTESYEKGKVVTEKSSIRTFTKILNRARHETRTRYKMAYSNDYKITVIMKIRVRIRFWFGRVLEDIHISSEQEGMIPLKSVMKTAGRSL
ncbi:hypothetical protein HP456_23475 [Bacillus haikouensis]|uniref:hypothetical protein n=1 Tax=Bacillus haikouensis TaxID=1510468 RepID=UPI001552AFB1|nr:hypothetical protein [Bacillus haikouensis]NQD68870.1 hypothetical protein [Bacillus haikouensis]